MIIAVDFDGTIVRSNYPVILGEQPYAGEALRKLHAQGHYIIIWTCRCGDQLLKAINWLLEHQIPFDRINDHNPENVAKYGEGETKCTHIAILMIKTCLAFPVGRRVWLKLNEWRPNINPLYPDSHATSTG